MHFKKEFKLYLSYDNSQTCSTTPVGSDINAKGQVIDVEGNQSIWRYCNTHSCRTTVDPEDRILITTS